MDIIVSYSVTQSTSLKCLNSFRHTVRLNLQPITTNVDLISSFIGFSDPNKRESHSFLH